jgi:acyl-CoA hydrolase
MDTIDHGKAQADNSFTLQASREALEGKVNDFINELSNQNQERYSLVKTRQDSHTEHVQIVMYRHTNGSGRLFGGALLQMIDIIGAICARRHSGSEVTTVAIDNLSFKAPASINSTLLLIAEIQSVGRTSMKVQVTTYVESLNGSREEINVANLTFVAIDKCNRPIPVPRLKETLSESIGN